MDDRRFDSLVKSLSNGGSRRGVLQTLGAGALAVVATRVGLTEDAEAKKKGKNKNKNKKKKCKNGTTKCGKKACCKPGQECTGGVCEDVFQKCQDDADCDADEFCNVDGECALDQECSFNDQCPANEICVAGKCIVCAFPNKPCGDLCCASDEACVDGVCLLGQGTCAAGEDICAGDDVTCNGNASCTCGIRFADGEPRCIQFVDNGRDSCTCAADFRCEEDFGPGTICIKGGANCPTCTTNTLGRCARLCPTQTGN